MIVTSKELYEKYKNFSNQKSKIQREIENGNLIRLNRGIYEDNKNVEGYLLSGALESPSYLSFEYALSKYNLIPERVKVYTSATSLKKHNKTIQNYFGTYTYTDVPVNVWRLGIKIIKEGEYSYLMATPEKALCDVLYKKRQVTSIIQLKTLLFDDLRIDEEVFNNLDLKSIIENCDLYKRKNLYFLKKYLIKEVKKNG